MIIGRVLIWACTEIFKYLRSALNLAARVNTKGDFVFIVLPEKKKKEHTKIHLRKHLSEAVIQERMFIF